MKEYISVGKNVDNAIENGLKFLGLDREDVDIKILETGGLFKKAKVCLQYEEKVEPTVDVKVEVIKVKEEPTKETVEEKIEEKVEPVEDCCKENAKTEQVELEIESQNVEDAPKIELVEDIRAKADINDLKSRVSNFLTEFLHLSKLQAEVECEIEGNCLKFKVVGENLGKLIGYHGETLADIQNLLGALKKKGEGKFRIYLDVAGYKADREQSLIDLANRMADKAEEIERNVHLDPMNAYERRIIHSTLQNRTLVETESMGEGEKRHVVIKFKR